VVMAMDRHGVNREFQRLVWLSPSHSGPAPCCDASVSYTSRSASSRTGRMRSTTLADADHRLANRPQDGAGRAYTVEVDRKNCVVYSRMFAQIALTTMNAD